MSKMTLSVGHPSSRAVNRRSMYRATTRAVFPGARYSLPVFTARDHGKCVPSLGWTRRSVEREDVATVERLLRSWCRVAVRRNKSLTELAEETSNVRLIQLLHHYSATSELAAAAFACDADLVRAILRRSRSARRTHLGQRSMLLGYKQFFTCSTGSNVTLPPSTTPIHAVRSDIAPGRSAYH